MASNTPNYGLIKPEPKDFYNVADFNANADRVDAVLKVKADLVNGTIPESQLPGSALSGILEYSSVSDFPATGEAGKIYVATNTNKPYRWNGTGYVEIAASLTLGETSTTAYRGDRGKTAYTHTSSTSNPHKVTAAQAGAISTTEKGVPGGVAALDANGLLNNVNHYATPITATYKMLANTQVTAASGTSTARKVGFYTLPMTSYIFGEASIRCWETNFDINAPSGDYYHVWVASNILCQPSGGTGSKTAYIHTDAEQLHAAEYQAINTNHKMTLSIPETYIGKFKTGDMFGISIKGWAANDIISTGTTVNGNGTWISIKAIKAVP